MAEQKYGPLTFTCGHRATRGATSIGVGFDDNGLAKSFHFVATDKIPAEQVFNMVLAVCEFLMTGMKYEQVKEKIDDLNAIVKSNGKAGDALYVKPGYVIERRKRRAKAAAQSGRGR